MTPKLDRVFCRHELATTIEHPESKSTFILMRLLGSVTLPTHIQVTKAVLLRCSHFSLISMVFRIFGEYMRDERIASCSSLLMLEERNALVVYALPPIIPRLLSRKYLGCRLRRSASVIHLSPLGLALSHCEIPLWSRSSGGASQ